MKASEKLYKSLEILDEEFTKLLIHEFELIKEGKFSRYLTRKMFPDTFRSRYWLDEKTVELEKIEKDLTSLCKKIDAPLNNTALQFISDFVQELKQNKNESLTGIEIAISKKMLKVLKAYKPKN